jgi:AraC-like DNA-binding protein
MAISPKAVRRAILLALDEHASTHTGRPLTVESVAADLHCSRSTQQRQLFVAGTTYSVQLRKVRALVAVKAIMGGANATAAARQVGLSPDHLRKLLLDECGIGPAGLRRCREIRRTFDLWTQPQQSPGLGFIASGCMPGHNSVASSIITSVQSPQTRRFAAGPISSFRHPTVPTSGPARFAGAPAQHERESAPRLPNGWKTPRCGFGRRTHAEGSNLLYLGVPVGKQLGDPRLRLFA